MHDAIASYDSYACTITRRTHANYELIVNCARGYFQVQGNVEHFRDSCGGVIGWLDSNTYYTAFTEGWALYAENPLIAEYTDTYKNEPMQKFGMLKWQVSLGGS